MREWRGDVTKLLSSGSGAASVNRWERRRDRGCLGFASSCAYLDTGDEEVEVAVGAATEVNAYYFVER